MTGVDDDEWQRFVEALRARLEAGAREYGNASFERDPVDLLTELHAEAVDIAGWGFVLATRIDRLRRKLEGADP